MRRSLIILLCCASIAVAYPGPGSRSSSSSRSSSPRFSSPSSRSSSSPRFTSPSSKPSSPAGKPSSLSKPSTNQLGSQQAKARMSESSRQSFAKTVKTPSGSTHTIPPAVASRVTPQAASTRTTRVTNVYFNRSYGGWSYHTYHSDPFHPMLTGYLLGRLSDPSYYDRTRDWVYRNYDTMDPVRREELLRENQRLRDDIRHMRETGAVVGDVDLGVDPDLLYNDDAAQTLYQHPSLFWADFWWLMRMMFWIGVAMVILWATFKKDWK